MLKTLKNIGPGAMVAAAFIGPGTLTTATMAGSGYGYTLLWAILFSVFATIILQEMTMRLGIIGGMGLGEALRKKIQNPSIKIGASILVLTAIFIGNAAYEAGNIAGAALGWETYTKGWTFNPLIILVGLSAFVLLYSGKYKWIERALITMVSLMGLVFLITAIAIRPDISLILKGLLIPTLPDNALLMVVGLIGTTVVPYNLFLHASAAKRKWTNKTDLRIARWDTILSLVFGGLITMAILISSAVAFEGQNREIHKAADLALQLVPLLGDQANLFIALGFFAAGLSSAITAPLAAAFATSEILGWEQNLKSRPFRIVWMSVLLIGVLFASLGFRPTLVILFAQVANGLLLPIIACFLLWIVNDRAIMGTYSNTKWVNIAGAIVVLVTILLGFKGVFQALGIL